MKYAVVYGSQTGIPPGWYGDRAALRRPGACSGPPDEKALDAPLIFAGFWTDKGGCTRDAGIFGRLRKGRFVRHGGLWGQRGLFCRDPGPGRAMPGRLEHGGGPLYVPGQDRRAPALRGNAAGSTRKGPGAAGKFLTGPCRIRMKRILRGCGGCGSLAGA